MAEMRQQPVSGLHGVLKTLGAMTSIRDTYLVEQSLLRTLGPMLGVFETTLYRLDDQGGVLRSVTHGREVITEPDGSHRVAERVEEASNDRNISVPVQRLLENVRMLGKPCTLKSGNDYRIGYPLRGGGMMRGVFVFQRDRELTPGEDAVINGTLEVFSNYYDLLDTSQRDQLTGLLNRYSLEMNLGRLWDILSTQMRDKTTECEDSQRSQVPHTFWVAVMDVDHFKKINDTYGHIIGDEVLIMVAGLLKKSFRQTDLLYRYGGEEFIAIIAANDLECACHAFERARVTVESFEFPQVGSVTISMGFSGADPTVLPQEVISRADSAMYVAKKDGRNRVYHYDTLVKQGVLKEVRSGSIDLF